MCLPLTIVNKHPDGNSTLIIMLNIILYKHEGQTIKFVESRHDNMLKRRKYFRQIEHSRNWNL